MISSDVTHGVASCGGMTHYCKSTYAGGPVLDENTQIVYFS